VQKTRSWLMLAAGFMAAEMAPIRLYRHFARRSELFVVPDQNSARTNSPHRRELP
jgi:hypothetical protein